MKILPTLVKTLSSPPLLPGFPTARLPHDRAVVLFDELEQRLGEVMSIDLWT